MLASLTKHPRTHGRADASHCPFCRQVCVQAHPERSATPTVSLVVVARNEERNLPWVAAHLPPVHEVVLADGNSTDGTVRVWKELVPDSVVVSQRSVGKGAGVLAGIHAASKDVVVVVDADGSMDPREASLLVSALTSGADVARGCRRAAGGGSTDFTRARYWGNRALTGLANVLYRQNWRELNYGFFALWSDVRESLHLPLHPSAASGLFTRALAPFDPAHAAMPYGSGFEIEALISCRAARAGLRVAEVPSFERSRNFGETSLSAPKDGIRVLSAIVRERL